MKFSTLASIALTATVAASCSTTPADETRSPAAAKELADAIAGKVAGPPQRCINSYATLDMKVIDDFTLLFSERGRNTVVYVQNPRGGCYGLDSGTRTLVTKQFGTRSLCDGDINDMIDLASHTSGGSCVFGPFVPYTKPKG